MDILPAVLTPGAEWRYRKVIGVVVWELFVGAESHIWIYDLQDEWRIVTQNTVENLPKGTFKDAHDAMLYAETRLLLLKNT